ncbi:MAG TPA: hypothetical protein VD906_07910 [Caulobacteraceae bacterium]|nr:hypothetical protein [Caulobacteraceae bacterium]
MAEKSDADLGRLSQRLTEILAAEIERLPDPGSEEVAQTERLRRIHLAAKAGKEIAVATLAAERAVRAIEALQEANAGPDSKDNEDMNDAEPKDIEQVYADLQSRLDRLTVQLERKRAAEIAERGADEVAVGGQRPRTSG